jgi:hypothetical protein
MAETQDQALIYDAGWKLITELRVVMAAPTLAEIRSGPVGGIQAGKMYRASIAGRYYACARDADGKTLQLNDRGYSLPPAI